MNYYFVTGSSKGIGKAIVELLLLNDDNFVFGYSRSATITNKRYYHKIIDFANLEAVQKLKFPELKDAEQVVLINNAGIVGEIKHVGRMTSQKIIDCYHVNLIVPAILTNEFVKTYQNVVQKSLIINISSGAGKSPIDGWGVYCSAKAGIDMLSKVIQVEAVLNKSNTQVLSIVPGIVDTDMQKEIRMAETSNFSNVDRFIEYKKSDHLASSEETATKIIRFMNEPTLAQNVVCSVRDIIN